MVDRSASKKPPSGFDRWFSHSSLRYKALAVMAIPVAALIASAILFAQIELNRTETGELNRRLWELRSQLLNVYGILSTTESALREFALTGHDSSGQNGRRVGPAVETAFDKMNMLLAGDPAQVQQLAQLREKARARLDSMHQLRDYYAAHQGVQPPPALADAARVSPDMAVEIASFFTGENDLVAQRIRSFDARGSRLRMALIAAILTGLVGGIFGSILFSSGLIRRIRWLESSAAHLQDGMARQPMGNDELSRLASALKKASLVIANQDRRLRLALENAQVLIWDLDPSSSRIEYHTGGQINNTILPVELLAPDLEGWIAGIHADDRAYVRGELDRVVKTGSPLNLEYRVVIRGGQIRWMAVRAQPHDSGDEAPPRFLGILADVTERRNAASEIERQAHELSESREALEHQTRILKSILDSMGDGVVVADRNGKFLLFNPAAQQIVGSRAFSGDVNRWAAECGLFLPDMVTRYSADQLPLVRAIHGESADVSEVFVRPAVTSDPLWVSITARPLRQEDGAGRGGVMVLRDITAAKRNADALAFAKQEAEAANQAKSEFLSRMSHELRTPLNSILGFAQLLELSDLNDQDADNVHHILKGGYHLLDLINEILDLARIEAGRLGLSPEPVRMREALRDALDLVRPLALEQEINLSPDVAIRCDRHVQADRQRLKQVLLNLLSNAIKFNRRGGSVALTCHETPGNRLSIEIADSGRGIPPEGLKKIFTPFERLNADQTEVSGTGLGLALSKRLMEAMGGTIGVESAVGLGSKFYIELPLLDDPSKWLEDNPEALQNAGADAARRGTVLYIEDNASNLRLIERIMAQCPDVRLMTAMQGRLGFDLAQTHLPDWILLDLHLPDIPGEEVLSRLRAHPRTRAIPVSVLSADATPGQINRILNAGARDYLTKPVEVRQLLRLLEQTLKRPEPVASREHIALETYAQRDRSE